MKNKPGITLAISHNIYLDRVQRYALAAGMDVVAQGVSVPVWYFRGRSSEPAVEVFNTYNLLNNDITDIDIDQQKEGYTINIPSGKDVKHAEDVPPELWSQMTEQQKSDYLGDIPTGESLRDPIDGGSGCLSFNQYNKSKVRGILIHVLHFVRIADGDTLSESLV